MPEEGRGREQVRQRERSREKRGEKRKGRIQQKKVEERWRKSVMRKEEI
jgi:hypothetical protein